MGKQIIYGMANNGDIFYVGVTSNFRKRKINHKAKYNSKADYRVYRYIEYVVGGWDNISFVILDEFESSSNEDRLLLEKSYIEKYGTLGRGNGYYSKRNKLSKEHKAKISKALQGRQITIEAKMKLSKDRLGGNNPMARSIQVFTKDRTALLHEFATIKEASEFLGVDKADISKVCKGKRKQAGGYFFRYK